jgi:hypothetical protein
MTILRTGAWFERGGSLISPATQRLRAAKRQLIALYILCALPLGMFLALAIPVGQAPDEPAHMARAEGLLHGAILAVRKGRDVTGVMVDAGLFRVSFGVVSQSGGRPLTTLADYDAVRNQHSDHRMTFAYISNTGPYFPAAYLPATLGLALGLALHLSPFVTMIMARLCMLAACLLLGSLALGLAAYGEALLCCLLLLPMTVSLAGSLNQDGVLISLACLSAAAMTRDWRQWKLRLAALLPLVLVLGSKPPYAPLLALALLPLGAPGLARRVRDLLLAANPVLIWIALISAFVIVPFGKPPYHPGPLFAGDQHVLLTDSDAHANLHILLAKPLRLLNMPLWLVTGPRGKLLVEEMIGILGWLNLFFPQRFYAAWAIALAAALLGLVFAQRSAGVSAPRPMLQFVYVCLLLLVSAWAIAIAQYLDWTLVGATAIDGVQGRYFIVLLPFLLLGVPWVGRLGRIPAIVPALPAIALGIYDLGYVPLKVIAFYYMV